MAEFEFRKAGIDVEFIYALDGYGLRLQPTVPIFDDAPKTMAMGHVGLCLSNLMLWKMAWNAGVESFVVFEDDVVLVDGFSDKFQAAYNALPFGWDIVHLGACCTNDKPTARVNQYVTTVRYPLCTHAMMYRRKALPGLIESFGPVSDHIDIHLQQRVLPYVNHFVFDPPLASQRSLDKSIPSIT